MAAFDNLSNPSEYLAYWGKTYRNELLSNILPFWMKYGLDKENGGYFTCVDRDGTLMDSTKSVWFQGRFAFILAYAYNHIEKNEEWLRACKNGIDFIEKHCFDTDGRMFFEVTATGIPVRKRRYVFSETFAAIAMAHYALASGDKGYAEKAVNLFKQVLHYKNTPGLLEPKFREGLVAKGHSFCKQGAHFTAAYFFAAFGHDIRCSVAVLKHLFYGVVHRIRFRRQVKAVAQHHGCA